MGERLQKVVDATAAAGKISPMHGNCKVQKDHPGVLRAAEAASRAGWPMSKMQRKVKNYHIGTGAYMEKRGNKKKISDIVMGKKGEVTCGFVLNFQSGGKMVRDWTTFRPSSSKYARCPP